MRSLLSHGLTFCIIFALTSLGGVLTLHSTSCAEDRSLTQHAAALQILPPSIDLTAQNAPQTIVLHPVTSDGTRRTSVPSGKANWKLLDPSIAEITTVGDSTMLIAKKDGETSLEASLTREDGSVVRATATVRCRLTSEPIAIEFNNHIQPILARNGCNMGACHGALAGKGGFRLSLRGYDPTTDHFNITRQDRGRRIDLSNPAASLVLAKPSGTIEHKGGLRLPTESTDYQLLARWISLGANGPSEKDPTIDRIEVLPEQVLMSTGESQPLIVRAHYSNGRVEDVTRWSKFTAADESVALVNEQGIVKVIGPGEGAVAVWFSSKIASARITVPFRSATSSQSIARAPGNSSAQIIDQHVDQQLQTLGLESSSRCSDSEFLRRASLDATGTLPTEEQTREFLADASADKRSRLVDRLLASPAYTDYWTYRWSDLLMLNSNLLRADGIKAYYGWIRSKVEANTPWDQFAREIVTARGEALENGATNFYAINQDPEGMTENICQAFMGLSIGCAKCHNHPLEKWTNDQYYAMANLFARVRSKGWGGDTRDGDSRRTVFVVDRGELIQPLTGKPQLPAPLDGTSLDADDPSDRRIALADWLCSPDNPYFTRAIVNRVWAAYFAMGIVNAVDDLRASNPPSNPQLMDSLCAELVANKYDLKHLMRVILNSETYQRSSLTTEWNQKDKKYFSHYYPRRLMAEVIHDAIADVTSVSTVFDKIEFLGGDKKPTKFYTKGTKAIQLYDSSVESSFLKTFGRNQRRITCECERSDEPSIIQVLNLNNGDLLNSKLAAKDGIVDQWIAQFSDDPNSLVESAFLRCLCRLPSSEEKAALSKELADATPGDRRVVVEDLLWSLLTSREFLFNH